MQDARILLAVHEPTLRGRLKAGLQMAGCLVAEAANGKLALDILREEPPQLLLLDLEIPAVGSVAILAELRLVMERRPRVITLARLEAIATALESVRLGASDFLIKPTSTDDVVASISSVLDDSPPRDYLTDRRLGQIRGVLLRGTFGEAEASLGLPARNSHAGLLNLAGIVHESHGRVRSARDFYLRAVCDDERYQAAWQNLKRLSELQCFDERIGESMGLPVAGSC
jgi:DNA-binding response OmpR family regulator